MTQIEKYHQRSRKDYKEGFCSAIKVKHQILNYIKQFIKKQNKVNILIAGAGKGIDLIILERMCKKNKGKLFHFYLIELAEKNYPYLKALTDEMISMPNVTFEIRIQNLIKEIPSFISQYDICIFSEVLEHLWDFEKELVLNNLNKYLKKGGILLISVPHQHLFKKVYYSRNKISRNFDSPTGHKGIPIVLTIKDLLLRKGFGDIKIKPTTIFINIFTISSKNYFLRLVSFLLCKLSISFSTELFIIARKTEELSEKWYNQKEYYRKLAENTYAETKNIL